MKEKSKYNVLEMKDYILSRAKINANTAIILGSGMGAFADRLNNPTYISYDDIPNYPISTVKGHSGELTIGNLKNVPLIIAKGRFHYYEGYDIETITLPIRLFNLLGVKRIIITNAAGSLDLALTPGEMMIIDSHMDCTFRESLSVPKKYNSKRYHDPSFTITARDCAEKID